MVSREERKRLREIERQRKAKLKAASQTDAPIQTDQPTQTVAPTQSIPDVSKIPKADRPTNKFGEPLSDKQLSADLKEQFPDQRAGEQKEVFVNPDTGQAEVTKKFEEEGIFTDVKTGRESGFVSPEGNIFLGANRQDIQGAELRGDIKKNIGAERLLERQEALKPQLEAEFEAAGVFKQPELTPIIESEKENMGVVKDIASSLIPEGLKKAYTAINTLGGTFPTYEGQSNTRAGIEMEKKILSKTIQSEVGKELDAQIDEVEIELLQQGVGVGTLAAGVGALVVGKIAGGTLGDTLGQAIGSDKTVKNLETSITNLDSISADIKTSVKSNALPPDLAFEKLNRIEDIIESLESQLQLAAIESPNVRVSLRGRAIETKILSSKEKLQSARGEVAAVRAAQAFEETDLPSSLSFLQGLQAKKNE